MIWFLEDIPRFRLEREAMERLAAGPDSNISFSLRVEGIRLIFDVDIRCGERVFPVSLSYPNHFPHTPPVVVPRNGEHWSTHQYGTGGELCLEYGADNWHPSITGAMMIESAKRLVCGESTLGVDAGEIASRHALSTGQDLRGTYSRVLITQPLLDFLAQLPELQALSGRAAFSYGIEAAVFSVGSIGRPDGTEWIDPAAPERLRDLLPEFSVAVMRWPEGSPLPQPATGSDLISQLGTSGPNFSQARIVVLIAGTVVHAWRIWDEERVYKVSTVLVPPEAARIDRDHMALSDRTVAIVGCGSIGSKIATSLARSGVCNFLLVDDDVFLPGNLVRHDLDWRDVGMHKVNALASRIRLVNAAAKCQTRAHRLGGQEASGSIETLIESLGACDVIVDASGETRAFNYLCAAAMIGNKPMVWAEIFGGGFGGLVARARPGYEPDPSSAKAIIEAWCRERGRPVERATDYAGGTLERPFIADDADVAVIAAHAARLAVDTLIKREPSIFPHSVYLVGLSAGWLFEQPFDTYPIVLGDATAWNHAATEIDPLVRSEEMTKILALVAKQSNATTLATGAS